MMDIYKRKIAFKKKAIFFSAHERNRTFTPLRTADFESAASTNSATWATIGLRFENP